MEKIKRFVRELWAFFDGKKLQIGLFFGWVSVYVPEEMKIWFFPVKDICFALASILAPVGLVHTTYKSYQNFKERRLKNGSGEQ